MNKNNLKMGPHDVGGEDSLPIDTTDNDMTHWEKYANALRIVVSSKRIITLDELRHHTLKHSVINILKLDILRGTVYRFTIFVSKKEFMTWSFFRK